MQIEVQRHTFLPDQTLSNVLINGRFFCYGLEDVVRESEANPVSEIKRWKVYGETAIPYGEYKCDIVWSQRFKRQMVYIKDVPGFSGILIHNGGGPQSTEGCLIVSKTKQFNFERSAMVEIEKFVLDALVKKEVVKIKYVKLETIAGESNGANNDGH